MRISTKGRYALRALIELAKQEVDKPIMLSLIATNQRIPQRYLIQIFSSLRKSGLVHSVRGAKGGFQLSKQPAHITLADIITSAEGPIELVPCTVDNNDCIPTTGCATRGIWEKVNQHVKEVFEKITLEEMVEIQKQQNNGVEGSYQI